MNAVDVVLAVVVVASVWGGWRRGLLVAGTNLLTLAVSLIGAFLLYPRAVTLAGRQGSECSASAARRSETRPAA